MKDVAAAGAWRHTETLLRSHLQVDAETVRQVVLHPTQRMVSRKEEKPTALLTA